MHLLGKLSRVNIREHRKQFRMIGAAPVCDLLHGDEMRTLGKCDRRLSPYREKGTLNGMNMMKELGYFFIFARLFGIQDALPNGGIGPVHMLKEIIEVVHHTIMLSGERK